MVKSKNRDHLNLLCDIGELANLIIGSTDIQGFLQQTVEMVARHLNADVGSIYLYEDLELFRSKPDQFDLLITDLTMPKMTGDRLLKEIQNIRSDIPIVLCTGFSEKMDGDKAKELGATGSLEKPHEKRELAKLVREVLD